MNILVDTSVWIRHFRHGEPALVALLVADRVLVHPWVRAEIACGTPPSRAQTLEWLGLQSLPVQASLDEVTGLMDREQLYGLGCGIVDLCLLASTLLTAGARLWTLDARLAALADRFEVGFDPRAAA